MQPFLVIQCLTEHVDTVLSYCVCVQKEVRNFKHYSQILLFGYTNHKPYLPAIPVPCAIIEDGLVDEAYFLNPHGLLISTRVTQSLMQAKNINWKVQKERMKVLNLLKITG
jgi:hypothetical protein